MSQIGPARQVTFDQVGSGCCLPVLLPECLCLCEVQSCCCQCCLCCLPEGLDACRTLGGHLRVNSCQVPAGRRVSTQRSAHRAGQLCCRDQGNVPVTLSASSTHTHNLGMCTVTPRFRGETYTCLCYGSLETSADVHPAHPTPVYALLRGHSQLPPVCPHATLVSVTAVCRDSLQVRLPDVDRHIILCCQLEQLLQGLSILFCAEVGHAVVDPVQPELLVERKQLLHALPGL